MPERVQFAPLVEPLERPALAAALVPLANAGYRVQVELPDTLTRLGWQVRLNRPGKTATLRLPYGGRPEEWTRIVAQFLE